MDTDIKVVFGPEPPHHVAIKDLPVVPNAAGVVTVVPLGAVHNDPGVLGAAAVGQHVPCDAIVASLPDAEGAGACVTMRWRTDGLATGKRAVGSSFAGYTCSGKAFLTFCVDLSTEQ